MAQPASPPSPPAKPEATTTSDRAHEPPPPLASPKVNVSVTPNTDNGVNAGHCAKVAQNIKQAAEKAIQDTAKNGAPAQMDAAIKRAAEEVRKVDGGSVKEVRLRVSGKQAGKPVSKEATLPTAKPNPNP
jgi:hypothetical protein